MSFKLINKCLERIIVTKTLFIRDSATKQEVAPICNCAVQHDAPCNWSKTWSSAKNPFALSSSHPLLIKTRLWRCSEGRKITEKGQSIKREGPEQINIYESKCANKVTRDELLSYFPLDSEVNFNICRPEVANFSYTIDFLLVVLQTVEESWQVSKVLKRLWSNWSSHMISVITQVIGEMPMVPDIGSNLRWIVPKVSRLLPSVQWITRLYRAYVEQVLLPRGDKLHLFKKHI